MNDIYLHDFQGVSHTLPWTPGKTWLAYLNDLGLLPTGLKTVDWDLVGHMTRISFSLGDIPIPGCIADLQDLTPGPNYQVTSIKPLQFKLPKSLAGSTPPPADPNKPCIVTFKHEGGSLAGETLVPQFTSIASALKMTGLTYTGKHVLWEGSRNEAELTAHIIMDSTFILIGQIGDESCNFCHLPRRNLQDTYGGRKICAACINKG